MKSLKIAFGILLCVTILSVSASVVCAVIAGNTADSFRDYRSSVVTMLSSLHAQLNDSKEAFADAMSYKDALTTDQAATTAPETAPAQTESEQDTAESEPESTATDADSPGTLYTVKELNGRIGVYDTNGVLLDTLNVAVATLPRADREQLAVGIALTSDEELAGLIADYEG